jgi:hypothetical protein
MFAILYWLLTMVMMPEWYGISDSSLPARISFLHRLVFGGLVLHKLLLSPSNIFTGIGQLYLQGLENLRSSKYVF